MEPGFLIASPQMKDPNFSRALVLLVQHRPEGALGLIINKEAPVRVGEVISRLDLSALAPQNRAVLAGGPVEKGAGFVLFRGDAEEGWSVPGGIGVSASRERLQGLLTEGTAFQLCLGYAGWGPGQLDREFETGSWVYLEPTPDLIFEVPMSRRYDEALSRLGVSAANLWMNPVDE